MARLPQPGSDSGSWGTILNDFLTQSLNADGTLKNNTVSESTVADGSIQESKLSSSVQTSLSKADTAIQKLKRPIAASYRPLKGINTSITSSIATGETTAPVFYAWNNAAGHYRYAGCQLVPFSDPTLGVNFNVGLDGSVVANAIEIEFWSNATTIRANFYNVGKQDVWAIVDDMRISDGTYQHADFGDSISTWTLTQSTAVWRKWRLCMSATTFRGIGINPGATMVPTSKGFQLAVIGDSYVAGGINTANAVAPGNSGSISAGALFGEFVQETGLDVWRAAVIGTGYIADGGYGAGGIYGSVSRMNAFAAIPAVDAVVVWSTANDKSFSVSNVVSAAQSLWSTLHNARPNTPLIVVGPECTGWTDAAMDAMNDGLRAAATANSNVTAYVDLRNHNFMSGTGREGSPQGNGNADVFISSDGSHLTHPGARYWGQNIARLLGTVMIPSNDTSGSF
ncbi:SGNH/GDSL hydrolase family protein [Candidatus Saccharibacteria bacterium]|nr:SGNH/GDSL hydrolase family protein [Candidatus Saccharibacteria bacterium]